MELIDIDEVQAAPKTELAPIERAAIALESSKTEQHLMALATKHQSITVVKDKAGREQAHGAYIEVMRARTAVEKAAKDAREDATKFSKAVIAEAARLAAIVEPEEARLKEARDVWDAEQARIKAEAEAIERARVLAITERISEIKGYVLMANNCRTSERVAELQGRLAGIALDESFAEFIDEAKFAHTYATAHLVMVHADRLAEEVAAALAKAEQERIKAEQAEEASRLKAERDEFLRFQAQIKAEADAAEAKVRAAAEELAQQRAEFERQLAEQAAKNKPIEQPAKEPAGNVVAHTAGETSQLIATSEPVACASGKEATEAKKPYQRPAPIAIEIVMVVAAACNTDTKTAARWITERAAEIETLKG